ncbi:hypothetical protein BaRGS_00036458, partial [Batillaria attramentaria]
MAGRLYLKDKFGNDLYFGNAGDIWSEQFPEIPDYRQHAYNLRHMELRPDDVILTGYPKAAEYVGSQGLEEFLEGCPPHKRAPPTKPRVFHTHGRFHHLPLQVREKKVKVLYLTRNPKDSWVSYYNFLHNLKYCPGFEGTWEHYFEDMMDMGLFYGDYFDHMLDWERQLAANSDLPIMTSNYEDMKKDPVGQICKIDKFLGLNRGRELCEKIAEACEFSALKAARDEQTTKQLKKESGAGYYRK